MKRAKRNCLNGRERDEIRKNWKNDPFNEIFGFYSLVQQDKALNNDCRRIFIAIWLVKSNFLSFQMTIYVKYSSRLHFKVSRFHINV